MVERAAVALLRAERAALKEVPPARPPLRAACAWPAVPSVCEKHTARWWHNDYVGWRLGCARSHGHAGRFATCSCLECATASRFCKHLALKQGTVLRWAAVMNEALLTTPITSAATAAARRNGFRRAEKEASQEEAGLDLAATETVGFAATSEATLE